MILQSWHLVVTIHREVIEPHFDLCKMILQALITKRRRNEKRKIMNMNIKVNMTMVARISLQRNKVMIHFRSKGKLVVMMLSLHLGECWRVMRVPQGLGRSSQGKSKSQTIRCAYSKMCGVWLVRYGTFER